MPCLKILTNLPKCKVPDDFVDKIVSVLSKAVKKPQDKFLCVVSADCHMIIAGDSKSPGVTATLESIGKLGPEENKIIVKDISEFVEKELGVPPSRFFLTFYDLQPYNVGIRGITVQMGMDTGLFN